MSESRISWRKTLAELLTIIVGVLLALFANNWRDTVRDHAQARAYEARLDQDVASDIQQYARAAGEAAAIDSAAVQVLAAYRGREVSPRTPTASSRPCSGLAGCRPPPCLATRRRPGEHG